MSIYKIKESSWVEKGNRGSFPPNKEKYIKKLNQCRNEKNLEKLLLDFKNLKINSFGDYIFYIKYLDNVPPKTKRIIFNLKKDNYIKNLSEVRQRYLITNYKNFQLDSFDIFYEINKEEYLNFINVLENIIKGYTPEKKQDIKVYFRFIDNILFVESIGQKELEKEIHENKFFRLLPIKKYLSQLEKEKIISMDNNSKETNIFRLTPEKYKLIIEKFPFLIIDEINLSSLSFEKNNFIIKNELNNLIQLKNKNNINIGIIDSGLSLPPQYNEFILINKDLRQKKEFHDYNHGTSVASLIISNDELNPGNKDGLGNFNIKHFEMLEPYSKDGAPQLSFEFLVKNLEKIIEENKDDVKVWNLSFGHYKIPFYTTISHLGKFIDYVSYKHNVLFIISAGNDRKSVAPLRSLNVPGDSLNSLTVGSVMKKGNAVTFSDYSSLGQILHFEKPEISQFGGPQNKDGSDLLTYGEEGQIQSNNFGTSFSTPRIARMAAFFINEGLTPMEAKAKIISLSKKETNLNKSSSFGYVILDDIVEIKVELFVTLKIIGKKPFYLDLNLPDGVEEIIICDCNMVNPNLNEFNLDLGEEYSIHSFETEMVWYAKDVKNPEYSYLVEKVKPKDFDKKYQNEIALRHQNGKYFTSHKNVFTIDNIKKARNELYNDEKRQINKYEYNLAVSIRKNDLFETEEPQVKKVSIFISVNGNFNEEEFYALNESIIDVNVNSDVEVDL